jgi:hypothetical protein
MEAIHEECMKTVYKALFIAYYEGYVRGGSNYPNSEDEFKQMCFEDLLRKEIVKEHESVVFYKAVQAL